MRVEQKGGVMKGSVPRLGRGCRQSDIPHGGISDWRGTGGSRVRHPGALVRVVRQALHGACDKHGLSMDMACGACMKE